MFKNKIYIFYVAVLFSTTLVSGSKGSDREQSYDQLIQAAQTLSGEAAARASGRVQGKDSIAEVLGSLRSRVKEAGERANHTLEALQKIAPIDKQSLVPLEKVPLNKNDEFLQLQRQAAHASKQFNNLERILQINVRSYGMAQEQVTFFANMAYLENFVQLLNPPSIEVLNTALSEGWVEDFWRHSSMDLFLKKLLLEYFVGSNGYFTSTYQASAHLSFGHQNQEQFSMAWKNSIELQLEIISKDPRRLFDAINEIGRSLPVYHQQFALRKLQAEQKLHQLAKDYTQAQGILHNLPVRPGPQIEWTQAGEAINVCGICHINDIAFALVPFQKNDSEKLSAEIVFETDYAKRIEAAEAEFDFSSEIFAALDTVKSFFDDLYTKLKSPGRIS